MAITFNAATKIASLSAGTTSLSVRDLWSRWVDWWLTSSNSGIAPVAMAQVGGDDIDAGAGTKIPIYVFLQNGWRVRPQEANHTLNVTDGILLVDGGGDPFVNTVGSFVVRINYQQPVQAISFTADGGGGTPATGPVIYQPTGATRVIGDDEGGSVSSLLALDETSMVTGEVSGTGLEVVVTVSTTDTAEAPSLARITGRYVGGAGHTITISAWNYILSAWEDVGSMVTRTDHFNYAVPLGVENQHPSTGEMQLRFKHSVGTYIVSHALFLDYITFEKVASNDAISSDIAAIRAKTDQLQFFIGSVLADVKRINDVSIVGTGIQGDSWRPS